MYLANLYMFRDLTDKTCVLYNTMTMTMTMTMKIFYLVTKHNIKV